MHTLCWLGLFAFIVLALICLTLYLELQGEIARCKDLETSLHYTRAALKRFGGSV
jgi:hypothetical protein